MADDYGLEQHAAKRTYTLSSATGGMYSGAGDSGSEAGGSGVTTPPGTKPKGRAGRKFITEPAPTKRAGQNRDAQRAYRERKEAYVRKLETEVAELRQRLGEGDGEAAATGAVLIANPVQAHSMPHSATALASSLTAGDCPSCAAERIKNADLVARNHLLEQELHQLRQEANNKSATPPATFSQELFNQEFALFAAQSMDATSNNSVSSAMALDLDSLSLQNQMYLKQDPFDSLFGPAFLSLQPTLSSPQPDGGFSHLTPVTRFFGSGGGSGGSRESSAAPYAVNPSPSTSASMDDWIDEVKPKISESRRGSSFNAGKTAVELYGPFMLEDTREKLKALPSLKNSKHVDDVLDAFVAASNFTDPKVVKKHLLRVIMTKNKLVDSLNLIDRQSVIEEIETFKGRNRQHINHMYLLSAMGTKNQYVKPSMKYTRAAEGDLPELMRPFIVAVKQIPSLNSSECESLIDELCDLVITQITTADPTDKEDKYFQMIGLSNQLQQQCKTEEDRSRFMLATEIVREGRKRFMDEWLKEVQAKQGSS